MVNERFQNNLAKTAVEIGVNIQPGQLLVINSPVETADFARLIAKNAFEAGAKDVQIHYTDELFDKLRLEMASEETLKEVPNWAAERLNSILEEGGAVISIAAVDPEGLDDVDTNKIKASHQALENAYQFYHKALMGNQNRWCVVSVPTINWAKKVFPGAKNGELASDLLWNAIIRSTYCNKKDPVAEWRERDEIFKEHAEWLNEKQFDKLRYKNSYGTDLEIGLPENHIWSGGSEVAVDGVTFFPNLPTEEIYTAPDRNRVNGTVRVSYPLVYQGKTIEDIVLEFKDGKVVDFDASRNKDSLAALLENKNADFLGEVALVPYDSNISDMNILFYNTLFDENASCHFAFGDSYPSSIENGLTMTEEELKEKGLNQSNVHVDFMIGTEDLNITGITKDGKEIPIFINGNFLF